MLLATHSTRGQATFQGQEKNRRGRNWTELCVAPTLPVATLHGILLVHPFVDLVSKYYM